MSLEIVPNGHTVRGFPNYDITGKYVAAVSVNLPNPGFPTMTKQVECVAAVSVSFSNPGFPTMTKQV